MNRLKDKVVFITGGGMGIGRAAAVLFASEGARIVVADLDDKAATETVRLVEVEGGQALAVTGDVAIEADVRRMIEESARRFEAFHVLYHCAGVLWKDRDRSVLETDERWWDRVVAINRSEEHTSELQSRLHLVCRLLLEKKKKKKKTPIIIYNKYSIKSTSN